jgi:hypothetical protein
MVLDPHNYYHYYYKAQNISPLFGSMCHLVAVYWSSIFVPSWSFCCLLVAAESVILICVKANAHQLSDTYLYPGQPRRAAV